jgi:ATP-dependent RNA helicase DDX35
MAEEEDVEATLISALYKPPALLPIAQLKDQLLYTIETYPVTIVVGETGSGKWCGIHSLKALTNMIR